MTHQGVSGLVVSRDLLVFGSHAPALALGAHLNAVDALFQFGHLDDLFVAARRQDGGLVHQIGQVGAREPGGELGDDLQVHLGSDRLALGVYLEYGRAADDIRPVQHHAAVETAGAQQSRVEDVGPVGGRHYDNADVGIEAVHLDQDLVERLLALVMNGAQTGAALAAYSVDFVYEDDAGGVVLGLIEEVAHARSTHADEHLHELRAAYGKERHASLAGHGARQQCFAGSGRADEQHALGYACPQCLKFLARFQELHYLAQVLLGFFNAGHILEGDGRLVRAEEPGARAAEAHGLVLSAPGLPKDE